jgi:ribosomal protein S18 acetylase RimI-like enzyme
MTQPLPLAAYHIRPARPDDEPFLTAMLELACNWRDPEPGRMRDAVEARYARGFGRSGDLGVIAESDSAPAGAAWCRLLSGADRGYGYVADDIPEPALAVSPGHRGAGLGSRLIDALKRAAAQAGYRTLSLSVEPDNAARRIYERAGFTRCGTEGGSWTMRVELDGRAA